jgi:SAM-dependent MidA family methyltransferase
VIFSNELLDAMPVHRLGWDARSGVWYEWGVTAQGTDLVWERMPLSPALEAHSSLSRLPTRLRDLLPDGFVTVVCPAANQWWTSAANALRQGWLLAFDYGLDTEDFFLPTRSGGTLRAYYGHQVNTNLLERLGDQDLTAHVDFTAIRSAGESAGLRTDELVPQSAFLTRILARAEETGESLIPGSKTGEFHTLTHPEHLGHAFQVFVQSRGVS